MKPDKSLQMKDYKAKITDMLFLETNELVFAVDNAILVMDEHDEIRTLYTLPETEKKIVALCACRAGNIVILSEVHVRWLKNVFLTKIKFSIIVISRYGVLVKRMTYVEPFMLDDDQSPKDIKGFKMTVNTNNKLCIRKLFLYNVKAFSQRGSLMWEQEVHHPIDVESTPLGSIAVLSRSGQLFIFSSDGHFFKKIVVKNNLLYPSKYPYSFCFKNDKELLFLMEGNYIFYSFLLLYKDF
ncbi:unnamed protein product [Mytilus coruscus]|uniref:Uncharacterized protein n=1 Tax=Mytilus coruscus TaxID=42192 RepID=A0A6J8BHV9_MYTCO|nr:unnamed protein product [Mytilus coruscus]